MEDKLCNVLVNTFCRALTIGQMQGKFQMVVVRHTGHAIQVSSQDVQIKIFFEKSKLRYFNMSRLALILLWLGAFAPFSPVVISRAYDDPALP